MAELDIKVNAATGAVTAVLGGHTVTLHATMARVADLQAAIGVSGFGAINAMLGMQDGRAIHQGLRCLMTSDNAEAIEELHFLAHSGAAVKVIVAALNGGLPEDDEPEARAGNAGGPAKPGGAKTS